MMIDYRNFEIREWWDVHNGQGEWDPACMFCKSAVARLLKLIGVDDDNPG